jgi:hypothetical protein
MILEPKHKNLKGPLQMKETVLKKLSTRFHMSIPSAFEGYYFKVLLYCWHSPFKNFGNAIENLVIFYDYRVEFLWLQGNPPRLHSDLRVQDECLQLPIESLGLQCKPLVLLCERFWLHSEPLQLHSEALWLQSESLWLFGELRCIHDEPLQLQGEALGIPDKPPGRQGTPLDLQGEPLLQGDPPTTTGWTFPTPGWASTSPGPEWAFPFQGGPYDFRMGLRDSLSIHDWISEGCSRTYLSKYQPSII